MIRRGTINDVELLHSIGVKTFDDTFGNTCTKQDMHFVLDKFFNYEQCIADLSDVEDHFYFHEENGECQGYMRINSKHDCPIPEISEFKSLELVRLYVLKDFHGAGVANNLMDFAMQFSTENGFEKLYLSVWEYNFRARGFYEKHGFINSGIENDFPLGSTPQTDLWFVKSLIPKS
jgi:ribosomal protein S18 acetylase RimI-like enzyme